MGILKYAIVLVMKMAASFVQILITKIVTEVAAQVRDLFNVCRRKSL